MIVPLFILASLLATCQSYQVYPLRMKTGLGGHHYLPNVSCASWRLAVEAYNIRGFSNVPEECEAYVGNYMLGEQYRSDSKTVCVQAYYYARELDINQKRDVWIFDIDETTLSNLPYYAKNGFGSEPYNETLWNEWVLQGAAPALPETLKLYGKLLAMGVKAVFLTGRYEHQRSITASNLRNAGYHTFERLILRSSKQSGLTALAYKTAERKKLVDEGFRIIGNMGDQWSDLLGNYTGGRTFKLTDPMYYIS